MFFVVHGFGFMKDFAFITHVFFWWWEAAGFVQCPNNSDQKALYPGKQGFPHEDVSPGALPFKGLLLRSMLEVNETPSKRVQAAKH